MWLSLFLSLFLSNSLSVSLSPSLSLLNRSLYYLSLPPHTQTYTVRRIVFNEYMMSTLSHSAVHFSTKNMNPQVLLDHFLPFKQSTLKRTWNSTHGELSYKIADVRILILLNEKYYVVSKIEFKFALF